MEQKKGIKWNLVLKTKMEMPSKYEKNPVEFSPYFHAGPYTSTDTEGLSKQLQVAYE